VSKLNALAFGELFGDVPQNVNFAISEGTVRAFLDANSVDYETAPFGKDISTAEIADRARQYTVLVECYK